MRSFQNKQRIVVDDPSNVLHGLAGTVERLRITDNGAWIKMDERREGYLWDFPADDKRATHALLYPYQCSPVGKTAPQKGE